MSHVSGNADPWQDGEDGGTPITAAALENIEDALDVLDADKVEAADITAAVEAHEGATDPHGDRAYAAALVDDLSGVTNASAARSALGLGTAATHAHSDYATAAQGTDARTPTAHAASHADGGSDELTLSTDQITALAEYIRDTIATALTAGSNITITPNDGSDTITIAASGGSGIAATTIDAKGDLLVGTADDTVARLAAGTNEYSLVADSAQTAGLKYAPRGRYATALLTNNALDPTASGAFGVFYYNTTAVSNSSPVGSPLTIVGTSNYIIRASTGANLCGASGTGDAYAVFDPGASAIQTGTLALATMPESGGKAGVVFGNNGSSVVGVEVYVKSDGKLYVDLNVAGRTNLYTSSSTSFTTSSVVTILRGGAMLKVFCGATSTDVTLDMGSFAGNAYGMGYFLLNSTTARINVAGTRFGIG